MNPIDLTLQLAARTYAGSLLAFRPWISTYPRNNVIAEANVTFHIARGFCTAVPGGHAFLEREFRNGGIERSASLKLDAYLTSPELAVLLETKILVDSTTAPSILRDIDRASPQTAAQQVALHTGMPPNQSYGLIVAECWKPDLCAWWNEGTHGAQPQLAEATAKRSALVADGWRFASIAVGSFHHGSPSPSAGTECFWLYAVSTGHQSSHSGAA